MLTVRTLRINDNDISSLDLSMFPKLRTLYADGNRIAQLSRSGMGASRLENLSLRNQRCSQLQLSKGEITPIKRLYVSGKLLPVVRK
jgi:Leucine-rich repeat (LRR) protein